MIKLFTGLAVASTMAVLGLSSAALSQDTYNMKFQSSDNAGQQNFLLKKEWAERVKAMSNGRIDIEMMPVGSVVKHTETLDAISAGILDGHVTDTSYFTGKDPAFGLLANPTGAWSDPNEMLLFIEHGGGRELYEELLAPYGLQFIGASATGLEAFVSKVPLNGVDDLKGLKMRAPEGLVQQVFAAAGAAPVGLPASEVFTSLDKGVISAADYTVFSTNHQQGLHDVAPHPVYPGFHSLPVLEVSMNKQKWDGMGPDLQAILRVSVRDFARQMTSRLKMLDLKAVAEAKANPQITVHDWPQAERAKFRRIATEQWKTFAAKSPNAQKVYETLTEFLTDTGMLQ